MKKVYNLIIAALLCVTLQAHAPMTINQDSRTIQKYENFEFASRQKVISTKLKTMTSDSIYNFIMASPFITNLEVNKRLFEVANSVQTCPVDLIGVMYAESQLDIAAENNINGAYGLIQFVNSTIKELGFTKEELKNMSILEHLNAVELYFKRTGKIGKMDGFMNLYLAVFWPNAVGKGFNYTICKKGTKTYAMNSGVDMNKDDKITSNDLYKFGKSRLGI